MKDIEYILPKTLDDLYDSHFLIFCPDHSPKEDWHGEFDNLQDAMNYGYTLDDIKLAMAKDFIRICNEIEVEE